METVEYLTKLVEDYKSTGLKLFDYDDDMKDCYEESLKQLLLELTIRNNQLNKKIEVGDIDEYELYSERYKIRVEIELINACIAIIDESIEHASVFCQAVNDIYNLNSEKQLLYNLAKLKR